MLENNNTKQENPVYGLGSVGDMAGYVKTSNKERLESISWDNNSNYGQKKGAYYLDASIQKNINDVKRQQNKAEKIFKGVHTENDLINKKFDKRSYPTDDTVLDAAVRLTLFQKYENKNYNPSENKNLDVDFALNYCLMYLKHKKGLGYGPTFQNFVRIATNATYKEGEGWNYKIKDPKEIRERLLKLKSESDDNKEDAKGWAWWCNYYRVEYKGGSVRFVHKGNINSVETNQMVKEYRKVANRASYSNGLVMRCVPIGEAAKSLAEARVLAKMSGVSTHGDSTYALPAVQHVAETAFILKLRGLNKNTKRAVVNFLYKRPRPINKDFSDWNKSQTEIEELSGNYDLFVNLESINKDQVYRIRADLLANQSLRASSQSENVVDTTKKSICDGGDTDTNARVAVEFEGIEKGCEKELANYSQGILKSVEISDENEKKNEINDSGIKIKVSYDNLNEVPTVAQVNEAFNEKFSNLNRESEINQIVELFNRCKSEFEGEEDVSTGLGKEKPVEYYEALCCLESDIKKMQENQESKELSSVLEEIEREKAKSLKAIGDRIKKFKGAVKDVDSNKDLSPISLMFNLSSFANDLKRCKNILGNKFNS